MTKDERTMFDKLLHAHERGIKLAPRVLSKARRILVAAIQRDDPAGKFGHAPGPSEQT